MNRYETVSDEILTEKAQKGDTLAEETLLNRYKQTVKSKARFYFIVGADSEDVVQEGMIGLFKAVRDYRCERGTCFKTFAELCINRQIMTAVRKAARQKHAPLNNSVSLNVPISGDKGDETLEMVILSSESENPEEILIMRDSIDDLCINPSAIFSAFEQEVWNRYLQGKNYLKIAAEMERSPKSIDNALQRIRKKIMSFLAG